MPLDTEQLVGESQATTNTILLVEDDPNISAFLVDAIAQETPYRAIVASDSYAALKLVRHFTPLPLCSGLRVAGYERHRTL
jgi:DNA-binding NtrC family response regulator